jgi:hypothetical protein
MARLFNAWSDGKEKREAEALALGMMLRLWPAVRAVSVYLLGFGMDAAVRVGENAAMRATLNVVVQEYSPRKGRLSIIVLFDYA